MPQDIKPAKQIIDEMVQEAKECIQHGSRLVVGAAKAKL